MDEQLKALQISLEVGAQRADAEGIEFWFARDLQVPLGYARWENFQTAIQRAMQSCEASGNVVSDHFRGVTKLIVHGKAEVATPHRGSAPGAGVSAGSLLSQALEIAHPHPCSCEECELFPRRLRCRICKK